MNGFFVLWDYLMWLITLPLMLVRFLFVSDMEFMERVPEISEEVG
jgi:hypothetical protein